MKERSYTTIQNLIIEHYTLKGDLNKIEYYLRERAFDDGFLESQNLEMWIGRAKKLIVSEEKSISICLLEFHIYLMETYYSKSKRRLVIPWISFSHFETAKKAGELIKKIADYFRNRTNEL